MRVNKPKKIKKKKANHPEVSDTFVFANHADRFILINALDQWISQGYPEEVLPESGEQYSSREANGMFATFTVGSNPRPGAADLE